MPNRLPMSSNPLRWLQWLSLVWAVAAGANLAIAAQGFRDKNETIDWLRPAPACPRTRSTRC